MNSFVAKGPSNSCILIIVMLQVSIPGEAVGFVCLVMYGVVKKRIRATDWSECDSSTLRTIGHPLSTFTLRGPAPQVVVAADAIRELAEKKLVLGMVCSYSGTLPQTPMIYALAGNAEISLGQQATRANEY